MERIPFQSGDKVVCLDSTLEGYPDRTHCRHLRKGSKYVVNDCFDGSRGFWCVKIYIGEGTIVYKASRFRKALISNEDRMRLRTQQLIKEAHA